MVYYNDKNQVTGVLNLCYGLAKPSHFLKQSSNYNDMHFKCVKRIRTNSKHKSRGDNSYKNRSKWIQNVLDVYYRDTNSSPKFQIIKESLENSILAKGSKCKKASETMPKPTKVEYDLYKSVNSRFCLYRRDKFIYQIPSQHIKKTIEKCRGN